MKLVECLDGMIVVANETEFDSFELETAKKMLSNEAVDKLTPGTYDSSALASELDSLFETISYEYKHFHTKEISELKAKLSQWMKEIEGLKDLYSYVAIRNARRYVYSKNLP